MIDLVDVNMDFLAASVPQSRINLLQQGGSDSEDRHGLIVVGLWPVDNIPSYPISTALRCRICEGCREQPVQSCVCLFTCQLAVLVLGDP